MKKNALIWIRNDQRLHDNEALVSALANYEEVLPVFVIDNRLFEQSIINEKRASNRRLNFLGESLLNLQSNYKNIGGNILCLQGKVAEKIISVCKQFEIDTIYTSAEYTAEEQSDELLIMKAGLNLKLFHQNTLLHIDDLDFEIEKLPNIFTEFRKRVEKVGHFRTPLPKPSKIRIPAGIDFSATELNIKTHLITSIENDPRAAITFVGGETQALKRLHYYLFESKSIANYKETRNELLGENYSSKFSAWLTLGNISARQIKAEITMFEENITSNESTYWLVFELLWRDYFNFVSLKYGKRIFTKSGIKKVIQNSDGQSSTHFENWKTGKTGNTFVDANMVELVKTGFMSNRGRQNVASYLVKDLNVNWQLGASFFEHHLIDFDASSNFCNWQYVAGIGNDPRENRYFNTITQAQRYDAEAMFIKTWLPHLSKLHPKAAISPWLFYPKEYKQPVFLKE